MAALRRAGAATCRALAAASALARRRRRGERGQVIVLAALSLCLIVGMGGLAIDVGLARVDQQAAQTAADAAAMAGADDLPGSSATAISDAVAVAAANHFTSGSHGVTVTATSPPTSSKTHNGDPNSVEVAIRVTRPTVFLQLFHIADVTVTATAVATATPSDTPPCALCILSQNDSQALLDNGNASVAVTGGGVTIDSASPSALEVNGNATISASQINIVGGYQVSGSATLTPQPVTGATPVPDPLAAVPPPQVTTTGPTYAGTCPTVSGSAALAAGTYTGSVCMNGSGTLTLAGPSTYQAAVMLNGTGTMNINPGIYEGGITVNGNGTLHLNPGIYVLEQPLVVDGNAVIDGSGVMLYFTCSGYTATNPAPCSGSGAGLTMNGNATYNLSGPTSGTYQGLVVFYDRHNTATLMVNGNDQDTLAGTFYAKAASATFNGNPTAYQVDSMFIVNSAVVNGNGQLDIAYQASQNYPLPPRPGSSVLTE